MGMEKAASFATKAEILADDGNKQRAVKLHRILNHADRVAKLSNRVVTKAEREIALYRIWNAYAAIQDEVDNGQDEYHEAHLRFSWNEYITEIE